MPYICWQIFGQDHIEWVWRITLGFGAILPLVVLFFRMQMQEPKTYQQSSMRRVAFRSLPWWLIFKKYWSRLLGVCVVRIRTSFLFPEAKVLVF